ncbi:MAG: DUF305 domain-containing protein [Brevundimonas sp.]|uniref:DUF305 domain-containing protein n=1 Tax=Brevundimonas sp. TaxID=1871086 RepID=UPI00248A49FF|nr:DUF305 domain-containing protein [Brevundimonas sp.]MDI1325849.1 DUF305 domain-containing protein [Brevundimonas sp.]
MRAVLTVLLAALALSACDGGGDPVQQALRETAAANQSATVRETAPPSARDHASTSHDAPPGDQAFAASEAAMNGRMTAASGGTVDQAYIARMIEHHRGAVAMGEVALKESRDPDIRRMARVVVDARTREIAEMQAWKPAPAN